MSSSASSSSSAAAAAAAHGDMLLLLGHGSKHYHHHRQLQQQQQQRYQQQQKDEENFIHGYGGGFGGGEEGRGGSPCAEEASGGGNDNWARAYGYVGNHGSPGDGGLGSGGGGAGGSGLGLGGGSLGSSLGTAIPAHREIFRDILGGRGEDFLGGYRAAQVQQQQQQQQRQQQQESEEGGRAAAAAGGSFVAYEVAPAGVGRNVGPMGGGIGLLRTGLHQHQHQQHQHQHQHQQQEESGKSIVDQGGVWAATGGGGVSMVRELMAPPRGMDVVPLAERAIEAESNKNQLQLVQQQQQQQLQQQQHLQQQQQQGTDSSSSRPHGRGHQPGGSTCKECGNQSKKDCPYQRCRTCCKSRGYDCSTHVKSTWVPAAKRRERQALEAAAMASGQPRPRSKRTRSLALAAPPPSIPGNMGAPLLAMPTSAGASPRSSDLPASSFRGVLPPEVRAQALFKCVRVTGIEDGENEYAYQATVKIGGHVFKGVLYDQGVEAATPVASLADLQLGARSSMPSSSGYIDPSQMYGSATLFVTRSSSVMM